MAEFEFNVLSLERTFAEKILALVRASYADNPAAEAGRKVRHLYDLHHLIGQPAVAAALQGPAFFELLAAVQADDATAGVEGPTRDWKTKPLGASWVFVGDAANVAQLRRAYEQDLPGLLHGTAPGFDDVQRTMQQIAAHLQAYDARASQLN